MFLYKETIAGKLGREVVKAWMMSLYTADDGTAGPRQVTRIVDTRGMSGRTMDGRMREQILETPLFIYAGMNDD